MKLITAEELIAAPDGTVFTYLERNILNPHSVLVKKSNSVETNNIYVNQIAYGENLSTTLFILKSYETYYLFEPNDLKTVITLLQQALDN